MPDDSYQGARTVSQAIEQARLMREGSPEDPRAAAFPHALLLAKGLLFREIRNDKLRDAALKEFDERIARLEDRLRGCKNFGEQLTQLEQALKEVDFPRIDLRKKRPRKGPDDDATLLDQYKEAHPRAEAVMAYRRHENYAQLQRRIALEFPKLTDNQLARAAMESPSMVACIVVAAQYRDLAPETVRDRISGVRTAQTT